MSCQKGEELLCCEKGLQKACIDTVDNVCGMEEGKGAHGIPAATWEDDDTCEGEFVGSTADADAWRSRRDRAA